MENNKPNFAVLSDLHIGGKNSKEKITNVFRILKRDHKNLDGVFIVGDMVDSGKESEFIILSEILKKELTDSNIKYYAMLGNHEYMEPNCKQYFKQYINQPYYNYIEIKNYPFITISNSEYDGYDDEGKKILEEKLLYASKKFPDKPIFVFFHIPISNTVYGSYEIAGEDNWGLDFFTTSLEKYSQVISFSGHSHYSIADEKSIMQKDFTVVNDGSLFYVELENGKLHGSKPEKFEEVTDGLVINFSNNDVVINKIDFFNDGLEIKKPWILSPPFVKENFVYTKKRSKKTPPYFEKNNKVSILETTEDFIKIKFPPALDEDLVHSYLIEIYNNENLILSKEVFSRFYLIKEKNILNPFVLEGDFLKYNNYLIKVYGIDSWGNKSEAIFN